MKISHVLDRLLCMSPMQPCFQWLGSHKLTVLAYHDVADTASFEAQIDFLTSYMHPVALSDVLEAINGGTPLPAGAVLLTFDDGDRSVFERGLPILRKHAVPAVLFVIVGLLDTDLPFWWCEVEELIGNGATAPGIEKKSPAMVIQLLKKMSDTERCHMIARLRASVPGSLVRTCNLHSDELLELQAAGVEIGNHTLTHPCLDRCTDEKVESEVCYAHERLTAILGRAPRAFAYPNGNADPRAAAILKRLSYSATFLFDHRLSASPPKESFGISRLRVDSNTPMDRFRIIVSGLHSALYHLRRRHAD